MLPWSTLKGFHPNTAQCKKGSERKRRSLAEEEVQESTERAYQAYGQPLNLVLYFTYLGGLISD